MSAFSVRPLRIASVIGLLIALVGFIYGLTLIIYKLLGNYVITGYSSIMAILLFVSGVIMMMLGLIGEYVGRIYISQNNAPQYVIRTVYNRLSDNQELRDEALDR